MLALVTGGARSGKSSFAELYSSKLAGQGIYIATAQAYDEEMKARIGLHQQQRKNGGFAWTTIEESYALAETLQELYSSGRAGREPEHVLTNDKEQLTGVRNCSSADIEDGMKGSPEGDCRPVILVDCLTLWLSNWLLHYEQATDMEARMQNMLDGLKDACSPFTANNSKHLVLVTNEVGYGLVPEYKLGRQFRDLSGRMNQLLACVADQLFLVTAGIPVELKSIRYKL